MTVGYINYSLCISYLIMASYILFTIVTSSKKIIYKNYSIIYTINSKAVFN